MGWVIALVIIAAVVALDVAMLHGAKPENPGVSPYTPSTSLFTSAERSFLRLLDEVVGDNGRVFSKVRVADVVVPGAGMTREDRNEAERKLDHSRFDFLLCNNEDLSVICAIPFGEGVLHRTGRSHAGNFLREVCHAAGVPLIHVPARVCSGIDEVRQLLVPHLAAVQADA